jgi:hypothetical protein
MPFIDAFKVKNGKLIREVGEGNAFLVWVMGMYLEEADLEALASEALTDGSNDKKIDFIKFDRDAKRIAFCQGYYSLAQKDAAPANKASDLNTAAAWLFSGDTNQVPDGLKPIIEECRQALKDGEVETIDLLYVHNRPESINVAKELQTAQLHVKKALGDQSPITVYAKELGIAEIENLFANIESHIQVRDDIICPAAPVMEQEGPTWKAAIVSVPVSWLHDLYSRHGHALFSANYRGFLGVNKRKKINSGIRATAEGSPSNFWVFNNGVTVLTTGYSVGEGVTKLVGISVINGAQTTGSIAAVDPKKHDLSKAAVLCRIIQSSDPLTIKDIVKYNNTQNAITSWDQYSNDGDQFRLENEFNDIGHKYSRKRGFQGDGGEIGIEQVAVPLLAFQGKFSEAIGGKNRLFDSEAQYKAAFSQRKARHILLVYTLALAIDERRLELKAKSDAGTIIDLELKQLRIMRYMRFKNFFIAVTAKCLETVIGQQVNLETVAFTPDAAKKTCIELAAAWSPVVDALLSLVATRVSPDKVADLLSQEGIVDAVAQDVNGLAYAGRKQLPFDAIANLVSPNG